MKRVFLGRLAPLAALLLAALLLCACNTPPPIAIDPPSAGTTSGVDATPTGTPIALITTNTRLSSTFGQNVWTAIGRFAGESGLNSGFYKAEENDPDAAVATLELAVRSGAKLVVSMDRSVTESVVNILDNYPDVDFILLDAQRQISLGDNAAAVRFAAEEAGWLAGYLALCGLLGPLALVQEDTESSQLYALGYLLGAEAAAADLGMPTKSVPVTFLSLPQDTESEDALAQIENLLNAGAGTLYVASPALQQPVLQLVQAARVQMVGLGLPLDAAAGTLLATVEFDPRLLVYELLHSWQSGGFPGGREVPGTVADGAIKPVFDAERFAGTDTPMPENLAGRFADGELSLYLAERLALSDEGGLPTPGQLALSYVVVRPFVPAADASSSAPQAGSDASTSTPAGSDGSAPQAG